MTLLLSACSSAAAEYKTVLDGLNEPRGLWLRADGTLCVAEAGRLAEGEQVGPGPTIHQDNTGELTCLNSEGHLTQLAKSLPHVYYNAYGVTSGPTDVVEMGGSLYLLVGEGTGELSRSLLQVDDEGSAPPEVVGDIMAFARRTATPDYFDEVTIISNPFAMIADPDNQRFLVTDGATGEVLSVGLDGQISTYSTVEKHEVLTGIAWGPDNLPYVASFSQLPHAEGAGAVVRLNSDGSSVVALDGLTTPIDLDFDQDGRLYVLEFVYASTSGHAYRGKTGRLLRFASNGNSWGAGQVLVEGLPHPTALLIGPGERIFISIHGAYSAPETGAVLRFDGLVQRAEQLPAIQYTE